MHQNAVSSSCITLYRRKCPVGYSPDTASGDEGRQCLQRTMAAVMEDDEEAIVQHSPVEYENCPQGPMLCCNGVCSKETDVQDCRHDQSSDGQVQIRLGEFLHMSLDLNFRTSHSVMQILPSTT